MFEKTILAGAGILLSTARLVLLFEDVLFIYGAFPFA